MALGATTWRTRLSLPARSNMGWGGAKSRIGASPTRLRSSNCKTNDVGINNNRNVGAVEVALLGSIQCQVPGQLVTARLRNHIRKAACGHYGGLVDQHNAVHGKGSHGN